MLSRPRMSFKPIVDILCETEVAAFSAFGRHCANDFLHIMGMFPSTPAHIICQSNKMYESWKQGIYDYLKTWRSKAFLTQTAGMCNSENPFAFNYRSFGNYFSMYIKVFRRGLVLVPCALYNQLLCDGLLNPSHVIGEYSTLYLDLPLTMTQVNHMS